MRNFGCSERGFDGIILESREAAQVDRIADVLYAISRFIVAVCILPIAIWFATFALLETIISDFFVRVLVSSAVGVGLFGILLILTKRVHAGAIMLDLSVLTAAVSLGILWNTLHSTVACAHGYFLATLLILYYLKRKISISQSLWKRLSYTFEVLAVLTGPTAISAALLFYSVSLSIVLAVFPALLVLYLMVIHVSIRDPGFGIIHSVLLGVSSGLLSSHIFLTSVGLLDLLLNTSVVLFGCGIGILVSSQVEREVEKILSERRARKERKPTDLLIDESEEFTQSNEEWIIQNDTAHVLSGIGVILISVGSSPIFLWLARLTELGLIPQFEFLFIPFTILLSLLVLAPSPVFFRLGGKINRSNESIIVRGIGLLIVLLASVTSFSWTQYNLWDFYLSLVLTSFLFVMGVTGLFRRIRRLWRNLWLRIVVVIRSIKVWIQMHPLQTGIVVDIALSSLIVLWIYPTLSLYPDPMVTIMLSFVATSSLIGTIGLLGLKKLRRRNQFLAMSWTIFLCSISSILFWALLRLWSLNLLTTVTISLQPFLLSVFLLKVQIPRSRITILYLPAVLSLLLLVRMFEMQFPIETFPFFTILSLFLLLAPILQMEYTRILVGIYSVILYSAVILLCGVLFFVEVYVFIPIFNLELSTSLIFLAAIFFIAYLPIAQRYETGGKSLQSASILGLALSISSLFFIYLDASHIVFRILVSLFVVSSIYLLFRNIWPEKYGPYLITSTWCIILALGSFLLYTFLIVSFSEWISFLSSGVLFSAGLLPLQRVEVVDRSASIMYLVLGILFGTSLVYLLTSNPIYSLLVVILLPIPVAFHYYNRFIIFLGTTARDGVRRFLYYAAINLVLSIGLVSITLSYIINQYLAPVFSSYPIPAIPSTLTFILIALTIWLPALYIRKEESPISIPIIISVISVIFSLNIITLIQHPDWIFSVSLAILISTSILTISRSTFPEVYHQYFIPVTWCSLLSTAARFGYLSLVPLLGENVAALSCFVLIGIGVLPLKATKTPPKIINLFYGLFAFPAALLLTYTLSLGLPIIVLTSIIVPIPVAYKQYLSGLTALAKAIEYGMRLAYVQITIHLVAVIGIAAAILSGLFVYLLYPFFQLYPISSIPVVLTFVTFLLLLWLPAFTTRDDEENKKPISSGLVLLFSTLSGNIIYLIQIPDLILSVLGFLAIFGFFLILASQRILFFDTAKLPAIFTTGSLVLMGIYVVPVDPFTKVLLLVLSSSLFSLLFLNETQISRISYPLITGSFFGIIFWLSFLEGINSVLLIFGYICIETFFLSFLENLRKYSWCIFASTLGIVIFILLEPIGISAILIGLTASIEILWRVPETPDLETVFEKYAIYYGNVKSFLIASIVASLIYPWISNLVVIGETFLFVLLVSLSIANRSSASIQQRYALSLASTISLSALVFTYSPLILPIDSLSVVYPSFIILAIFTYWSSRREPYRQANWHMFSAITAFLVSLGWYIIYSSVESVILVVPTFVSAFLLFEMKVPGSEWKSKSELIPAISSIILLAEIIWVWHAILYFTLEPTLIFIGTGLILLSTILFPTSSAIDWFSFIRPWKIVSAYASLCLTILLTGWNVLSLQLPNDPLLSIGIGFTLYSLFATPLVRKAEKSRNLEDEELNVHKEWFPAIIGSISLGLQFGIILTPDVRLIFGLGLLGFSLAGIIYFFLMPGIPRSIAIPANLSLATSIAIIFWVVDENSIEPVSLLLYSVVLWVFVSLPVTIGKIKSFFSLCRRIISENKVTAAFVFPVLLGMLIGIYLSPTIWQIPLLELILIWNFAIILIPASLYFVGAHLLEELVFQRLRKPTIALLGPGVLLSLLILVLSGSILEGFSLVVQLSLSLTGTFLLLALVGMSFSSDHLKRIFYGVAGLAIAPTVYSFLPILIGVNPIYSILGTVLLILIIEAPLFSYQLKRLVIMLKDLGLIFRTIIQKFNSFMRYVFDRFGFIAWTIFSVAFVSLFGIISYPFFSELLNMPIVGFLYVVPSVSFPTMILGLMLLFIGIVRRKVESSFGSVSGFLSVIGFGATAFCGLYDNGYPYLAVTATILAICLLALILRRELDVGDEYLVGTWIPIPLTVTAILLYYLYFPAVTLEEQILAILLSAFPACCLYIASTYVSWIPKTVRTPLWIALSLLSGSIAYLSSYLAVFPPLATIYLSVFIASIVMYPVTGRKMIHLFFAPLFFALTGFAFTFLFGQFYQNLLLALASALFFVSRFVKEKRDESPEKVYLAWLRVAILIALLLAVAVFVISVLYSLNIGT